MLDSRTMAELFTASSLLALVAVSAPALAGDKIVMWYAAANFDERVFDDPLRYDIGRPKVPANVAFGGGGAHFCPPALISTSPSAACWMKL